MVNWCLSIGKPAHGTAVSPEGCVPVSSCLHASLPHTTCSTQGVSSGGRGPTTDNSQLPRAFQASKGPWRNARRCRDQSCPAECPRPAPFMTSWTNTGTTLMSIWSPGSNFGHTCQNDQSFGAWKPPCSNASLCSSSTGAGQPLGLLCPVPLLRAGLATRPMPDTLYEPLSLPTGEEERSKGERDLGLRKENWNCCNETGTIKTK